MTATPDQIRQSWIPKGRGKGGMFSNSTPYDSDMDTLVAATDVVIESNSWVPRPYEVNPGSLITGAQTSQWGPVHDGCNNQYIYNSLAIGNYYLGGTGLYSAVYGSVQSTNQNATCPDGHGGFVAVGQPLGGVVLLDPFNGADKPIIPQTFNSAKWTFQFVKNRMFMADGVDRPAITNNPVASSVTIYPSATVYPWGVTSPVASLTYTITTGAITAGNIDVVGGATPSATITGHSTAFNTATVGQTIFLLGVPYVIANIVSATSIIMSGGPNGDGTYHGATGNIPNGGWQINTGNLSWLPGAGYIYSYAYWDSQGTGHVSNMAPLLYVNDGPPNNGGVSITLNNIQQLLNATGTAPDPRFDKIVIYRSAVGGGPQTLFPLAVISNSAASPPYTYVDTQSDDTKLGTVGPGNFPGPLTTNHPPPTDLNFIAYWNGRFWGFSNSNPGLLFFSARVDSNTAEIPVGVAEESWPLGNTIPIPDSDGVGTGNLVVGANLMVLTTKGIYTVLGGGPGSYQLSRITSKGNGTSHFATCALPGEDANSADALVHVGNDGRVYFLYGAGGDVSYSYPIQDQLFVNPVQGSTRFVTDILHNSQGAYLLVCDNTGFTFAYDMERQVWFQWSVGFNPSVPPIGGVYAMCSGIIQNRNVFLVSTPSGISALQEKPDPSVAYNGALLQTQRVSPPGVDRFDTTMVSEFDLYDVNSYNGWAVFVGVDGKALLSYLPNTDTTTRQLLTEPSEIYFPRTATAVLAQGRTFQCQFISASPASKGKLFKLAKAEAVWIKVTQDTGAPPK